MAAYYPMMMKLSGKRCVVAGGGTVAERKVLGLLEGGADDIVVVAPLATAKICELAEAACIVLHRREYKDNDALGAFLVIAATGDRLANERIAVSAEREGALVNVADLGEAGDFMTPAVVRRGELVIALTTGGASPALSALLKRRIAGQYGPEYEAFIERLQQLRKQVLNAVKDAEVRAAVLRLAAAEMPASDELATNVQPVAVLDVQAMREQAATGARAAHGEEAIEQWMNRLLQAVERGR